MSWLNGGRFCGRVCSRLSSSRLTAMQCKGVEGLKLNTQASAGANNGSTSSEAPFKMADAVKDTSRAYGSMTAKGKIADASKKKTIYDMVQSLDADGVEYVQSLLNAKLGKGPCRYDRSATNFTHRKLDDMFVEQVKLRGEFEKMRMKKGEMLRLTYIEGIGYVNWLAVSTVYWRITGSFPFLLTIEAVLKKLGYL